MVLEAIKFMVLLNDDKTDLPFRINAASKFREKGTAVGTPEIDSIIMHGKFADHFILQLGSAKSYFEGTIKYQSSVTRDHKYTSKIDEANSACSGDPANQYETAIKACFRFFVDLFTPEESDYDEFKAGYISFLTTHNLINSRQAYDARVLIQNIKLPDNSSSTKRKYSETSSHCDKKVKSEKSEKEA